MKRTTFFKILTVIYIVVVAVLCFANFNSLPTAPGTFLGFPADKVIHFFMFTPFPILAYFSFPLEKKKPFPTLAILVLIFAVGCCIAGTTEYVQGKLPYRTMDINDFKADMLGMAISTLVCFLVRLFHKNA